MHCPQCGQQQVSEEVRFCKGCGFPLSAVKELLSTGGISPTETEVQKPRLSPRRRGVRQGAILLFIAMCLLPLAPLLGERGGEVLPLMFIMAGLMRMLYARIFQEGAPPARPKPVTFPQTTFDQTHQFGTRADNRTLPPAQSIPVTAFQSRRSETKEMVEPPSVTENTTKLLNDSPEQE